MSKSWPVVPDRAQEVRCRPNTTLYRYRVAPSSGSTASGRLEQLKPDLLKAAEGQWVVIVGDELIGPMENDEEAQRAGHQRFGLGPLYIKQVLAREPPPVELPFGLVPCQI